MSKRAHPTNGSKPAASVGDAAAGRRRTWWQWHVDSAEERCDAFSRNVDRRHLRLVGAEDDDSRKCTSCGKSERKAGWMITGLSALLCDECVKARIRKALGRAPRTP